MAEHADEVDRVVAAWAAVRPDLDLAPMQVLSRVTRLARHLDRYRRGAFAALELARWEIDLSAALRLAGEPYQLPPGPLGRPSGVTSGTMTNRVDRRAARSLVRRSNHPADRRGVLVTLTDEGRTAVDAAIADLLHVERRMLTDLDPAASDQLAALLRRVGRSDET